VGNQAEFNYQPEYPLVRFKDSHPAVMKQRIENLNWDFRYDDSRMKISLVHRIMNFIEQVTGLRPFSFKNYKL
jgi:hypothetical protein